MIDRKKFVGLVHATSGGFDQHLIVKRIPVIGGQGDGLVNCSQSRFYILGVVRGSRHSLQVSDIVRCVQQGIGESVLGLSVMLFTQHDMARQIGRPVIARIIFQGQLIPHHRHLVLRAVAGLGAQMIGQTVKKMQVGVRRIELKRPAEGFRGGDIIAFFYRLDTGADKFIVKARIFYAIQHARQRTVFKRISQVRRPIASTGTKRQRQQSW